MSVVIPSLRAAIAVPSWAKNELWRRARAVPSLDLRFADNKSLVDAVTGASLVTFTRASSKTVTNSAGVLETVGIDVPAFDHNPTTGESLGLLVEEQRTNLLLRSEEFDNASWTKTRSSATANAIAAPDGATTAEKLVEDSTASATHQVSQTTTKAASAIVYAASIYIKAGERSRALVGLADFGGNESYVIFNLSAKTVGTPVNGGTFTGGAATITELSNGWFRCSISATSSTSTTIGLLVRIVDSSNNFVYTGDGTSGIYVWGAQLEAGAFPTSYTGPTTTAAVTRSADVCSITGSAFSSWYRQDEGTVFAQASSRSSSSANAVITQADSNGSNEIFSLFHQTDEQAVVRLRLSNSIVFAYGFGTLVDDAVYKMAGAYRTLDSAASLNGASAVASAASFLAPTTFSVFRIGTNQLSGEHTNGHIRRLTFWPARLPNSTLQGITS
jgi:hypothetical protein